MCVYIFFYCLLCQQLLDDHLCLQITLLDNFLTLPHISFGFCELFQATDTCSWGTCTTSLWRSLVCSSSAAGRRRAPPEDHCLRLWWDRIHNLLINHSCQDLRQIFVWHVVLVELDSRNESVYIHDSSICALQSHRGVASMFEKTLCKYFWCFYKSGMCCIPLPRSLSSQCSLVELKTGNHKDIDMLLYTEVPCPFKLEKYWTNNIEWEQFQGKFICTVEKWLWDYFLSEIPVKYHKLLKRNSK